MFSSICKGRHGRGGQLGRAGAHRSQRRAGEHSCFQKKKRQMNYFFYFLSIFFQAVASEASAEAERIRTESAEALVRNFIHICPTYHEIPSENRTKFISLKIMFSGASDRALRVRPLSV